MRRFRYSPGAMASQAEVLARHRVRPVVDPITLPCRIVPDLGLGFEAQLPDFYRGPEETEAAVYALWCYCTDETPKPFTGALYRDLGSLIGCMPNGSLWAALPAVVELWWQFGESMKKAVPFPKPSARPTLSTLAVGHLAAWWWSLAPQDRYRAGLKLGLLPGGPTTPNAGPRGWHDGDGPLPLPATTPPANKDAFAKFLRYHRWQFDHAAAEWERSGQCVPSGLDPELINQMKQDAEGKAHAG